MPILASAVCKPRLFGHKCFGKERGRLAEQLILNQLSYSLRSNKVCWQIRAVVDLRQISAGRFVLPCLAPFWLQ